MKIKLHSVAFAATVAVLPGASLAATTVYVPLGAANEVLVVDAAGDRVVRRIADVFNAHGLAVSPDGKRLFAGSITKQRGVQGKMPPKPKGMSEEAHKRHHNMQAGGSAGTTASGYVTLIDAATGRIERRIEVPGAVHHTAVSPDGRLGFATLPGAGAVSVVDLNEGKLLRTIATGPAPNYLAVSADGRHLYVSNSGNATVSDIDTANWKVNRVFKTGRAPEHLVLSKDGSWLYVNNVGDGTLSVISLEKGRVTASYPIGSQPHGVDLSDDGATLYASSKAGNRVTAIDLASGKRRTLALAPAPYHVTAVHGTGKLYVSSRKKPLIWVIDQRTLEVLGEIPTGGTAHQMAVAGG